MTIFDKAQITIQPFLEMSGYEPKTTFWSDFTIAEAFGEKAVKDTFKRAFGEWQTDKVYITELALILNWKIWYWNEKNQSYAKMYDSMWKEVDAWCMDNLKGDDLQYYLQTTD